ncbi:MAG: ATP-binding cassette domain-containing protein, partial [Firmicutes bacterium]|nr:ATP-binding cassette domain-containing protein [Bacillota bacterium]
ADRNVKDAEMFSFAVRANVDRMIRKLERGYSTVLTADGDNLSEGQKQLLSITRAFISKPRILILDAATSNVDTRTEKNIQDAMVKLMKGRTSLVIAHRLATIRDADVIVVMDQGRIVEQGDHETLLAQKGKYYELYMTQFAGRSI